ncbi:MAG: SlyX family protein [Treponema sp.]|jgi:SlyX protein|nr:SlyX family protein [Treponema sp.]
MVRRNKKPGLARYGYALERIEERLESLETKLAYLEDFVTELQGTVLEGNAEFDRLKEEHRAMKVKLLHISQEVGTMPQQKPPHY